MAGKMKEIKLSQGYVAIVDDEDYERVAKHKWYALVQRSSSGEIRSVYATRKVNNNCGVKVIEYMHRIILGTPTGFHTDHVDGNGLNNCRSNLRACTASENQRNRMHGIGYTSRFRGVSWDKRDCAWLTNIKVKGKTKNLGRFDNEIDAAVCYNNAAISIFGEFARINIIGGGN